MKLSKNTRYKLLLLIITHIFCFSGCWDRKELKTQALVVGVGIDRTANGQGTYVCTFQIIKPGEIGQSQNKSGGGGGGGQAPVWVRTSSGRTPYEAARNIAFQSSRVLFYGHNQAIVFGKDVARHGIRKIIDSNFRFYQSRPLENLLISKGTAKEILEVQDEFEKIPAFNISGMLIGSQYTSEIIPVTLQDLFGFLVSKTRAPIIPQIEVFNVGGKKNFRLAGMAVFQKDRWVGELNKTETRGLAWVLGRVKRGVLNIPSRRGTQIAAVEIVAADSKVQTQILKGKVTAVIQVNAQGNLGNILIPEELTGPHRIQKLESAGAVVIRKEILAAWRKARHLNTDVFGFGEMFHRKYPHEWRSIEPEWKRIFPQITLKIKVNFIIKYVGEIVKSALPK